MSIADRPLIFLRHDSEEARHSFESTFGDDFEIAAFSSDAAATEALAAQDTSPAALFLMLDHPSARTGYSLLTKARDDRPGVLKVLLGESIQLSLLVDLLDAGLVDRCFEQPIDPDLIRSHVLRAALSAQSLPGAARLGASPAEQMLAVLIVDDETTATRYLARQLERMQSEFQVLCAEHAEAALALMREQGDNIAVIMTDQRMPGMHGKELLDELKQSHPCAVRILTSAYGEVAVAMDAINEGEIFRYQKKPWRAADCLPLFREALARHRELVSERDRDRAHLEQHFKAIINDRIDRLMLIQASVDEIAGRPVMGKFIKAVQTIQALPVSAAHLRASVESDLERALISQFSDLVLRRLAQMKRIPACSDQSLATFQDELRALADSDDEPEEPQTLPKALAHALTTLLVASGQSCQNVVFTQPEPGVGTARVSLQMYTHLLAPLSRVSRPLLEQQVAFLMLHVLCARAGCELAIEGGQQAFALTLRFAVSETAR